MEADEHDEQADEAMPPVQRLPMGTCRIKHVVVGSAPVASSGKMSTISTCPSEDDLPTDPLYVNSAAGRSARGLVPKVSCMKGSSVRLHDGVDWPMNGVYEVHEFVHHEPLGRLHEYPMSHRIHDPDELKEREQIREMNIFRHGRIIASAITRARNLAIVMGYPVHGGWPVAWVGDRCFMHHPPKDGVVDSDYLVNKHLGEDVTGTTRLRGMAVLHETWDSY